MSTLLIRDATVLVTMDDERREIAGGGLFARDGWIEQVGVTADLPREADVVLDLTDHVVIPGLVNTHHHLYQTLTRAFPGAQDRGLFGWLRTLYPVWARLRPDDIRVSTQVGLTELALSGATTVADHLYLFPNGSRLDDEIEAASAVGVRLVAARGSMSLGESDGGLPPDAVVEDEAAILEDTERVVGTYHDPEPGAMTQVVVAPCSPFSVTPELMAASADLARRLGVRLHTHLAETADEERFCRERFGRRPVELAEDLGWVGDDVWYAHAVHISDAEVARMGATRTGVAHCPTSNMRLGSGIAPVARFLTAGVPVGLGVDGSASNDGNDLLGEARQAMLVARLAQAIGGPEEPLFAARAALELATRGGADVLGRPELGRLAPGHVADLAAYPLDRLAYAGAEHDPVAALLLCAPTPAAHVLVHGRAVVADGRPVGVDVDDLVVRQRAAAARLRG